MLIESSIHVFVFKAFFSFRQQPLSESINTSMTEASKERWPFISPGLWKGTNAVAAEVSSLAVPAKMVTMIVEGEQRAGRVSLTDYRRKGTSIIITVDV